MLRRMKMAIKLWHWFKSASVSGAQAGLPEKIEDTPLAEGEDPFAEPVVWEITDTIDLHSVAPREIQAVVEAYLEEAYARGFTRVRIIHVKGKGVQRQAVRTVLAHTAFVREFHDAADSSSWGATIAQFALPDVVAEVQIENKNAMAEGNRL
jgi:hypothetical protein